MKHYAFPGMYLKHHVSACLIKFHVTRTQKKKKKVILRLGISPLN